MIDEEHRSPPLQAMDRAEHGHLLQQPANFQDERGGAPHSSPRLIPDRPAAGRVNPGMGDLPAPGPGGHYDGGDAAQSYDIATLRDRLPAAPPRVFDIAALAEIFDRSPRTIRDWIARKKLPALRIGRTPFVTADDLERLIRCSLPSDE